MKKLLAVAIIISMLFIGGCSSNYNVWEHDSFFKNYDHAAYSLWGYKDTTANDANNSVEQEWFGEKVPYVPVQ